MQTLQYYRMNARKKYYSCFSCIFAVITGATDGIGKGYAFELARKGFSIVLISRSASKLDLVKEQLILETKVDDVCLFVYLFRKRITIIPLRMNFLRDGDTFVRPK